MNRLKPHLALLTCNVVWALDYPFYNIVLPYYVHPMAMISASLIATALLSLIPLLRERAERVERADIRRLIGAALLIGVLRKVFLMYGLSKTSPIDGSIIDTVVPLLVLLLSVALGIDRFTRPKVAGLVLGMAGAVAVVLTGAAPVHAHSQLWGNLLVFASACATAFYMVWFKRLVGKYRITTVLRWLYCIAAVMAAAIYILSSISYTQLNTPFSARGTMEIYTMRSVVYFGGVALLFAYQSQLCDLSTQREADALRNMLHLQYENYKARQESVDLINQKYHDLKHQIAVLRSESGEERNAVLDRMEQEIKAYEAQNDTGNKVLDTVLTGKSLTCRAQNIQLTVVADGAALDFMDVMDISNLFGNALDNAIESTDKITDPERRLIHLSVARQKGFAAIRIENCFDGELKFEKGLPVTTKKDVLYHGFGVKSIQNAAAKYGGTATITTREGWFELRVLIPLGQPQQE